MKVLVDTCVWSAVLRYRNPDAELTSRLKELINDGRVCLIGPIRQEILSGVPDHRQFNKLKDILSAFEDIVLKKEHFEKAAEFSNICRSRGIQGSTTDFLICAAASLENLIIFTTDNDFENYRKHLSLNIIS